MLQKFLLKQMLKKQLAGMPAEEQDKLIKVIENNPEFFGKIAEEIQNKIKSGQDQMSATMAVMKAHQEELKKTFNNL